MNGQIVAVLEPYSSSSEEDEGEASDQEIFWLGNNIPLPITLPSRRSLPHPSTLEDEADDYHFYCLEQYVDKQWAAQYKGAIMRGLALALHSLFHQPSMTVWQQRLKEFMDGLPQTLTHEEERAVTIFGGVPFQSKKDICSVLRGKKLVFLEEKILLRDDENMAALPSRLGPLGPEPHFNFSCLLKCSMAPTAYKYLHVLYAIKVMEA
jgi:hypothetical protein